MSLNPQSLFACRIWGTATQTQPRTDPQSRLFNTRSGNTRSYNLTAQTVVKATAGRVAKVNVLTAGSTGGTLSDCATTGAVAAGNLIWNIPNTVGIYDLDWEFGTGLVYTPGTSQVVAISWD